MNRASSATGWVRNPSQELSLVIKQSLKFLDALCFSIEDKSMLFIRHSRKVNIPIIISNPIKMMHYPPIWEWFVMSLLPYQYMLTNVASFISSRVFRKEHTNITSYFSSATLPYCITYVPIGTNSEFEGARLTMLRSVVNEFATRRALLSVTQSAFFRLSKFPLSVFKIILTEIFFTIHKLTVTQYTIICKEVL